MTLGEFREQTKDMSGDLVLVLSSDEEGNGYRAAYSLDENNRFDNRNGEIGLMELTEELKKAGYSEEDVMEEGPQALVIW